MTWGRVAPALLTTLCHPERSWAIRSRMAQPQSSDLLFAAIKLNLAPVTPSRRVPSSPVLTETILRMTDFVVRELPETKVTT